MHFMGCSHGDTGEPVFPGSPYLQGACISVMGHTREFQVQITSPMKEKKTEHVLSRAVREGLLEEVTFQST